MGKVALVPEGIRRGIINQALLKLTPSDSVSAEFLKLWMDSDVFQESLREQSGGAAIQNVASVSILKEIRIHLPPPAEQQRIVRVLDEAFAALATAQTNAEKNLQNARALFESHLQSVFTRRGEGWVEKTLGNVCNFLNGFAFKSGDAVSESKTQLVRMGNIYSNRLDLDRSPAFYPDHFAAEYSRYVLAEGDIIMSLTGTTGKEDYGFAVRIPECDHSLLMNQRIMKLDAIRCDIIDSGYLLHYLRSRSFLDILYPTAKGTRQANLSSVTMQSIPVPLPSLDEQKSISAQLNSLSAETQRLTRIYEQKQAALAALKKSLLHQAFTGDL
jgi:type I restriction enzyme S subunit